MYFNWTERIRNSIYILLSVCIMISFKLKPLKSFCFLSYIKEKNRRVSLCHSLTLVIFWILKHLNPRVSTKRTEIRNWVFCGSPLVDFRPLSFLCTSVCQRETWSWQLEMLKRRHIWMLASNRQCLLNCSVILSDQCLEHEKLLVLSFCLHTEIFICTTSQKGIVLRVPSRERGGYCQYESFFFFIPCKWQAKGRAGHCSEMTAKSYLLPPLKKPQWCELAWLSQEQKPLHRQGKTSYAKSAPQSSDREYRGHEPPLPTPSRTILATSQFLKSLQKTHTVIHFNWHLQVLVIDHLEKRQNIRWLCGKNKGGLPSTDCSCLPLLLSIKPQMSVSFVFSFLIQNPKWCSSLIHRDLVAH